MLHVLLAVAHADADGFVDVDPVGSAGDRHGWLLLLLMLFIQ